MRNATMMMRFLDLTLILLMAFLLQADLVIERQVALPHGGAEGQGQTALRLSVTAAAAALVDPVRGAVLCRAASLQELETCLGATDASVSSILVSPSGPVEVQRMVDVLDACVRAARPCGLASGDA